jgi:hypothetical protein
LSGHPIQYNQPTSSPKSVIIFPKVSRQIAIFLSRHGYTFPW